MKIQLLPVMLLMATSAWAQTPPAAKLADVTMSADATRRAHLQEINLETARKLADACVAFSRAANPNGGATVIVEDMIPTRENE